MKKLAILLFVFSSIFMQAQVAKIIKSVNAEGDIASFELDCSKNFQVLAKGLHYNISRHEFKGVEKKNVYHLLLVMEERFISVLNKEMTISAVFSDGSKISKKETVENDGFFDGACTLKMKGKKMSPGIRLVKVIVHNSTDKDQVYVISEKEASIFKSNLANIIDAK